MSGQHSALRQAAAWIAEADGLIITAGAGMGADSGLPDFWGAEGFWRAYPELREPGLRFEEIANPYQFSTHPSRAWGFYGHRLALYRRTQPHVGFRILQDIAAQLPKGSFVFTSNVDGQFQRAGFDPQRLVEVHGSIHHLQCQEGCRAEIWPATAFAPEVDEHRCELLNAPPRCPVCDAIARPNLLMFRDWKWLDHRTREQQSRFNAWYAAPGRKMVTLEIGAGTRVSTVRRLSESVGRHLIRLNPQLQSLLPSHAVHLRMGALEGLNAIYGALIEQGLIGAAQTHFEDIDMSSVRHTQPDSTGVPRILWIPSG